MIAKRFLVGVCLSVFSCLPVCAQHRACDVTVNGVRGHEEDVAANTSRLQQALDHAATCGGAVTFQSGTMRTGALFVKTGTTFRVDKGATLLGSQDIKDYPLLPTRVAGIEMTWPAALVNVYKQQHVTITGDGTIDGDGKVFWDSYWALRKIQEPQGLRWASDYDAKRPRLIQIFDSSDVKLGGGIQLHRSGFWTVHICYSHHVAVDGVAIRNNEGGKGPSTDGIDIDSSHDILVAHADIEVNDDALCLKAGRDADGLRVHRPTENVVIRDSIIRTGAAAVTFGSETSGGFYNIEAYNLTAMKGVNAGVLFKSASVRGGGGSNLRIHDLHLTDVPAPIVVNLNWNPSYSYATLPPGLKDPPSYYTTLTTRVPEAQGLPHFSDIHIWNVEATGARVAIQLVAYPNARLERVQLDHIHIAAAQAGRISDTVDTKLSDIELRVPADSKLAVSDNVGLQGLEQVRYLPLSAADRKAAADLTHEYDR